jgi:hypothetical protein
MKDVKRGVGASLILERRFNGGNGYGRSASARLDCLYFLMATSALYLSFSELCRHGTLSRALVAALTLSPLVGGILLGLRGHVVPTFLHAQCGGNCAIAAILPLLTIRQGAGQLLRVSWWSVAQIGSLLALITVFAGLGSIAGVELGSVIYRLQQRKALEHRPSAGIPIGRTTTHAQSWSGLRSFRLALGTPVLTAAIAACGAIVAAIIAKL